MSRFKYIVDVDNLLNDFKKIDLKDVNELMAWFYKVIYYNIMYEDKNISNLIYTLLSDSGYQETDNSREATQDFYNLLNKSSELNETKISHAIIGKIMRSLKNSDSLDEALNSYIRYYNETFNHKKISEDMMKNLLENTGVRIVFVKYVDGDFQIQNGTLEKVEEYQAVTINGERIPFIGYNTGVKTIYSVDGQTLYNNNFLTKESDLESYDSITSLNEASFGSSYNDATSKLF